MKQVPVNLICGPLGVGKTTAIRHLLDHRPEGERWAVLVNEYGLVGLDAALLADIESPEGIDIREVTGGCICCSAGVLFDASLTLLLEQEPDRLLIEPTGLAAASGILDSLDREHVRDRVDIRSTICLLDPATVDQDRQREEVEDQIEAADILLASRCDLATSEQLEAFSTWAEGLFPQKEHVGSIEHGLLAGELLDLVAERQTAPLRTEYSHGTDHHHPVDIVEEGQDVPVGEQPVGERPECSASQAIVRKSHISPVTSTIGWICWRELLFDTERVFGFLAELVHRTDAQRVKAVLHTDDGWWNLNFTRGVREAQPTAYRRDSRIEVIIQGDNVGDLDALEDSLRQSLVQEQES